MEELKENYGRLQDAYAQFGITVHDFEVILKNPIKPTAHLKEDVVIIYRESLIQRFEYCYDLTWKFLKAYLKAKHGIDIASPRKVFQECYRLKLISQQDEATFLSIAEARNNTTHVYDSGWLKN